MDNAAVAQVLFQIARALEYLNENPYRVSAYRKAAEAVMHLDEDVAELAVQDRLAQIPGIGKTLSSRVRAWVMEHDFSDFQEVISQLPPGFDELLKVPGLGFKRIRALQQERGIGTVEDLLEALKEGRLSGMRAFPKKFLDSLPQALERVQSYRGKCTLDRALQAASDLQAKLSGLGLESVVTGQCRRGVEVVEAIELLVPGDEAILPGLAVSLEEPLAEMRGDTLFIPARAGMPPVLLTAVARESLPVRLLLTTGSEGHIESLRQRAAGAGIELTPEGVFRGGEAVEITDERAVYGLLGLQELPPEVREGRPSELERAGSFTVPALIASGDIRGTIHNHSTYSDGMCTLSEMSGGAVRRGYAWIGISDHSRSASYAGGLDIDAVLRQHAEIDELNRTTGIAILKGIESDILPDGSLDYPPEVLALFDFVVASVHSGMDMDIKAMTKRIVRALRNPFTSVLGHPTGRILLAREPYAVDMETVLDEALRHRVAVEINANPQRLDLDWRLVEPFTGAGGVIALSPDAHTTAGLDDMRYGVMMGRKGFLTPEACLNAWDTDRVRGFLRKS
ncbi:MAG TPA: helix-hairpin-helix domain-containing protein [Deltaproteobacteria bacterium]|nr:helix-hairpin-helix domain-containing protein [Deltaproteobacteria bacterium]HOI05972.1 helix-hairpin-helix domain-containing protein [Deltaproteobacteria bacterium]